MTVAIISLCAVVKPDGTLQATDVKWGYIQYATLAGGLRQARGAAGGQEFDMVAINPGPVEVIITLNPEQGAVTRAKKAEPTKPVSTATVAGAVKNAENVPMDFEGQWIDDAEGSAGNYTITGLVVDSNGVIIKGRYSTEGADCISGDSAIAGTFKDGIMIFATDFGCGPFKTTVKFVGKNGTGTWRVGRFRGRSTLKRTNLGPAEVIDSPEPEQGAVTRAKKAEPTKPVTTDQ